jgi:hypothetical protein
MARTAKSGPQDLISRISDTIADHPRVSAAAAFQMGVLLGQAMQHSDALKGLGRKMAAAPGMLASSLPTFGLFDSAEPVAVRSKSARSGNARSKKPARASTARSSAKRSKRTSGARSV